MKQANRGIRATRPPLLERLYRNIGSWGKVARAMGVKTHYCTGWRAQGFIPEQWALAVDRLGLADEWGEITAYDVLFEAETAREARVLAAQRALDDQRRESRQASAEVEDVGEADRQA